MTGTIQGTSGGSFAFFLVRHPGDGRTIRVTATMSREDRAVATNVGLNLYKGSTLEQQNLSGRDAQGRLGANVTATATTPTTYGIQLFNYNANVPLTYRVNVVGLDS